MIIQNVNILEINPDQLLRFRHDLHQRIKWNERQAHIMDLRKFTKQNNELSMVIYNKRRNKYEDCAEQYKREMSIIDKHIQKQAA